MRVLIARSLIIAAVVLGGAGVIAAQGGLGSGSGDDDDAPREIREQTYEYAGTRECRDCHHDSISAHANTPHARTLVELEPDMAPEENPIVADFSVGADLREVTFPDESTRPFNAEDVAYTLGSGVNAQAYVYAAEDGLFVFPAEWRVDEAEWVSLDLGSDWLGDDHAFGANCAGCHAQGVNVEDDYAWEEDAVMCESCHGPGLDHVEAVDDAGRDIDDFERSEIYALINLGLDSATCGSCHVRGLSADGAHPYPANHFPDQDLAAAFNAVEPGDDAFFYSTGHARLSYMQYNEALTSSHAAALSDMQSATDDYGLECLICHSVASLRMEALLANEEIDPETVTVASVVEEIPHGVTCASCHNAHMTLEDGELPPAAGLRADVTCVGCHMDTDATDGLHVATTEVFQGIALVESVEPVPSAHFSAEDGPTCTSCHMATVDTPRGPRSSHTFNIVNPAAAPDEEMLQDSCSGCHEETPASLGDLIDDIQVSTAERVEAARSAVNDDTPAWVSTALDAVERDGSNGVHNYAYTDALLDAVETELNLTDEEA
ncbi:MAG: ammonia-forming cytochrome c nitrite reductase subunit c552 [Chloroflexota bacterium]